MALYAVSSTRFVNVSMSCLRAVYLSSLATSPWLIPIRTSTFMWIFVVISILGHAYLYHSSVDKYNNNK